MKGSSTMRPQSESELEQELLQQLSTQYNKVKIHNADDLMANFRHQMNIFNQEALQHQDLTDKEFNRVLLYIEGKSIYQSAKILRDKFILTRDDNSQIYFQLFDGQNPDKNIFQITHQISVHNKDTKNASRYDVTLLINGLPLVQIELKRRGNDIKKAFNQIYRYKLTSYCKLFRFIQIFIISNGVDTKYYANSDNNILYSLTFFWTNEHNKRLNKLSDFASNFLNPNHLIKMISDYMIINDTDKNLMIMRPYQVYATQKLIHQALTTNDGGYIWHTTGSGKTLTSFKSSQLLAKENSIKKVFFVVDRSDLDRQTTQEFNKFEVGSVDATDNTAILAKQIQDEHKNFIVTTIQKLAKATTTPRYQEYFAKYAQEKVIIIFDECHRSTFGKQLTNIKKTFTKAQIFGFTGTPRFIENKSQDNRTTADIFGKCLHTYLIKDAIFDHNVLGFNVEYIKTFEGKYNPFDDTKVENIDKEEVFAEPKRLKLIAQHIIDNHDRKTNNRRYNALFAVANIKTLIAYYHIFKELNTDLRISAIFTYEENEDLEFKQEHSKDSLEKIITDYNKMYNTNYHVNTFSAFASDLMKKIKTAQIDIVIVVGMMLTGFDAKVLNTLYVDKNLEYHNLLQAYSRTNRVEHTTKPFGNIVCYRNLKTKTDDAIRLFSQTGNIDDVLVKDFAYYLNQFREKIKTLLSVASRPEYVDDLNTEKEQKAFVLAFRDLIKIKNILNNFTEFDFDKQIQDINIQDFEDYKSKYFLIHENLKNSYDKTKTSILDDIDFCIELVATDNINLDYIMNLIHNIERHDKAKQHTEIEQIKTELKRSGNPKLRYKIDLIEKFLNEVIPNLNPDNSIDDAFKNFEDEQQQQEIKNFAITYDLEPAFIAEQIQEYNYSGLTNRMNISSKINKGYLQKKTITNKAIDFIKEHVAKYF